MNTISVLTQLTFCILSSVTGLNNGGARAPIIQTTHGKIKGKHVPAHVNPRSKNRSPIYVETFQGVPFAEPPVGDLRFAAPMDTNPWDATLDTSEYKPACLQLDDETFGTKFRPATMWNSKQKSEDCLYLNIWRPKGTTENHRLPVMVWIFGGGFVTGSNHLDVYDGRVLSNLGQVIVVSINYRVGLFGFFPPIEGTDSVGNVGLLDQRLGLRWVYENAANLGGDRSKITIFGESAGSVSVGLHVLSRDLHIKTIDREEGTNDPPAGVPLSTRYFKRAIMQSASPLAPWSYVSHTESLVRLDRMAKATNCLVGGAIDFNDPVESSKSWKRILVCLRNLDAATIVEQQWVIPFQSFMFPWVPTVGGALLPVPPKEMYSQFFNAKLPNDLDLITGWNTNEGSWPNIYLMEGFNIQNSSAITEAQFNANIKHTGIALSAATKKMAKMEYVDWQRAKQESGYQADNGHILSKTIALRDALNAMVGDYHITCPAIEFNQLMSSESNRNVYNYVLDYRISNIGWPEWAGVMHGYEIEFVFGLPLMYTKRPEKNLYNDADRRYASFMMRYWSNFAHSGNPNIEGVSENRRNLWANYTDGSQYLSYQLPSWRQATQRDGAHLILQTQAISQNQTRLYFVNTPHPNADKCNFWKHTVPYLNSLTENVDQSMLDWKEDMRRWREAMKEFDGRRTLYEGGNFND